MMLGLNPVRLPGGLLVQRSTLGTIVDFDAGLRLSQPH